MKILVRTVEDYAKMMDYFEANGYTWASGQTPKSIPGYFLEPEILEQREKANANGLEVDEEEKYFYHILFRENNEEEGRVSGSIIDSGQYLNAKKTVILPTLPLI